jgi:hypothetical protein
VCPVVFLEPAQKDAGLKERVLKVVELKHLKLVDLPQSVHHAFKAKVLNHSLSDVIVVLIGKRLPHQIYMLESLDLCLPKDA